MLKNKSRNLAQMVHNIVVDMAVDNADLVDTNFVIDYLRVIALMN